MSEAQSYLWDFGDGRKSTEPSPVHVYQMPGIYHGKLTLTDENGNTFVSAFVIRAYDWDLLDEGGVHATYTNKCYRAAVVAKQGSGIVEWGGDDWVWPEGLVGPARACRGMGRPLRLCSTGRMADSTKWGFLNCGRIGYRATADQRSLVG